MHTTDHSTETAAEKAARAFWQRYECDRTRSLDNFAQGSVYAATDKETGSRYALKIAETHPAFDVGDQFGERWLRTDKLQHAHLLPYTAVHRWDIQSSVHYAMLMPLSAEGCLLHAQPASDWTEQQRRSIWRQVTQALDYLHTQGGVMQCLHASHVLLFRQKDGGALQARLINYGAKRRLPLAFFANYEYLAPEQIDNADQSAAADPRSDSWALGVLAYWLWTGQLPFGKKSPKNPNRAIAERILEDDVPELLQRLPLPYRDIVAACLQKDPAERPTCAEILAQLPASDEVDEATTPAAEGSRNAHSSSAAIASAHTEEEEQKERRWLRRPSRPMSAGMILLLIIAAIVVGQLLNYLAKGG